MIARSSVSRQFSRYIMSDSNRCAMSLEVRASPRKPRTCAKTGDARLDHGTDRVAGNLTRKLLVVLDQVRARAGHAHRAGQHIQELRATHQC